MGKFKDLTGKRFNRLIVIKRVSEVGVKEIHWLCVCDCGKEVIVIGNNLRCGISQSCGCLRNEIAREKIREKRCIDLTGQRFNRLIVIRLSEDYRWLCKCDCGKEKRVSYFDLNNGKVQSCGCLRDENLKKRNTKHNLTRTRIYGIWLGMKDRCLNPKCIYYHRYGGRGITICEVWKNSAKAFYDWAMENGYSDELSIDRINNDSGYSPDNCRWVTQKQQANNTSRNIIQIIDSKEYTLKEIAEKFNIKYATVINRFNHGDRGKELIRHTWSKSAKSNLNGDIVKNIKRDIKSGIDKKTIMEKYNVSGQIVSSIIAERSWQWVTIN